MVDGSKILGAFDCSQTKLIEVYLEVPENWNEMSPEERRDFEEEVLYRMMLKIGATSMPTSMFESAKHAIATACTMAKTQKLGYTICGNLETT